MSPKIIEKPKNLDAQEEINNRRKHVKQVLINEQLQELSSSEDKEPPKRKYIKTQKGTEKRISNFDQSTRNIQTSKKKQLQYYDDDEEEEEQELIQLENPPKIERPQCLLENKKISKNEDLKISKCQSKNLQNESFQFEQIQENELKDNQNVQDFCQASQKQKQFVESCQELEEQLKYQFIKQRGDFSLSKSIQKDTDDFDIEILGFKTVDRQRIPYVLLLPYLTKPDKLGKDLQSSFQNMVFSEQNKQKQEELQRILLLPTFEQFDLILKCIQKCIPKNESKSKQKNKKRQNRFKKLRQELKSLKENQEQQKAQ